MSSSFSFDERVCGSSDYLGVKRFLEICYSCASYKILVRNIASKIYQKQIIEEEKIPHTEDTQSLDVCR